MIDAARRATIRAAASAQRAAALGLRGEIADAPTKALLTPVLNTLNDVESVFLASVLDDRTPGQESWWLDAAERWLHAAERQFQEVTKLIRQYGGPDKVRTTS